MKVCAVKNIYPNVTFKGFKQTENNFGENEFEFNFPFDDKNYDCYLEIYNAFKDQQGRYCVDSIPVSNFNAENSEGPVKLINGKNKINLEKDYLISEDMPFAYHYKLFPKNGKLPIYCIDNGDVIDYRSRNKKGEVNGKYSEVYNLVTRNGSKNSHGGSMKLIIPDNFNVGYYYNPQLFSNNDIIEDKKTLQKAQTSFKHFSNKMGGTLAGIEKALDDGELDAYSSIITLPLFTDDNISSHGYWNKNCMQMIPTIGNINHYASLQRKMFAKGINLIADGAFVNEGLCGIHFANLLKWGKESPYFYWFKALGLENKPLSLGVFGKNTKNISHKLVNSPYEYLQDENGDIRIRKNRNYRPTKPTYIQIFDERLASKQQQVDKLNLIESYDNLNTFSPYDINTHDDTVINYYFEINPETYNNNIKNLIRYNDKNSEKIFIDSFEGTRFLSKFENFSLDSKIESNFDTWDANTDIAKLNYVFSNADVENGKNMTVKAKDELKQIIQQGNAQVQDYVMTSGMFWTQKTKDILGLYVAQNLKDIDNKTAKEILEKIQNNIDQKIFPQKSLLSEEVIENIINHNYKGLRESSDESYKEQVLKNLMNFPLDSIEFGDNTVGVLASPYLSKRATHKEEIGLSEYDLYKQKNPHLTFEVKDVYNKKQEFYVNKLLRFTLDILEEVNKESPEPIFKNNGLTKYGEYVLPILVPEIEKFAIIKSLKPTATVFINSQNGEIGYNYHELKNVYLQSLGIEGESPEDEALQLLNKIDSGLPLIESQDKKTLINALYTALNGTSANSFALSDAIINKSEAGLDWRIDATKDIADIDGLRNEKDDFATTWQNVLNFWTDFNKNILKINNKSYIVAELTDENSLYQGGNGYTSRFYENDLTRDFLNETGMTATANYSHFFTDLAMIFANKAEFSSDGNMSYNIDSYLQKRINEKLIGSENYLRSSNLNSLLYSYTFLDNHDKPRILHSFALDMGQFFANLSYDKDNLKRQTTEDSLMVERALNKMLQENNNNYVYRERAYRILNDKIFEKVNREDVDDFDYSHVSSKAMAMASAMISAFGKSLNALKSSDGKVFNKPQSEVFSALIKSIEDLAQGKFLDGRFNPDAFGVKPFDVNIDSVIKQAEAKYGLSFNENDKETLKMKTFETIIEPAYTKLLGAMKFLVALPGKPTLYSGDDLGATGYETPTKNIYLQNRTYLHNEWKENPFIRKCYDELNYVMNLRKRPELDALNNGAPYVLPLQIASDGTKISSLLRQNTDGKMAISLFNTKGIVHDTQKIYTPKKVKLDEIKLTVNNDSNNGLRGGLREGLEFVNANNSNDVYKVMNYNGYYVIKHKDESPIIIDDSTLILYHVPQDARLYQCDYKPFSDDIVKQYQTV